ncbi:MAG: CDP-alcohol phosphatidyltransferase family protein [Lachnospiraceae bacterium]|nr:CDP-alcohol phosphatidyltransferase family protein [Lachnospiraceae bacterium]
MNGGLYMRGRARKEDLFKIPNILCYIRILLVPFFVYLYLSEYYWQSAIVLIAASLTDIADGYIARHFNMITDWGKFIDPVADKLMQFSMLFVITFRRPLVLILIVEYVLKEVILLVIGLMIYHKGFNLNGANWAGKLCTVVFDSVMFLLMFLPDIPKPAVLFLISLVSVFLIIAFCSYLTAYISLYKEQIKNKE